jgi:hypothetical protein
MLSLEAFQRMVIDVNVLSTTTSPCGTVGGVVSSAGIPVGVGVRTGIGAGDGELVVAVGEPSALVSGSSTPVAPGSCEAGRPPGPSGRARTLARIAARARRLAPARNRVGREVNRSRELV